MAKKRRVSFLQAAIPVERGPAAHFERQDALAMTVFEKGQCTEIHTPQTTLQRIHEVLHAKHSPPVKDTGYYKIRPEVREIIEDCRLHLNHWPWSRHGTPPEIFKDCRDVLNQELAIMQKNEITGYPDFASRLRAQAVMQGMGGVGRYFPSNGDARDTKTRERDFANSLINLISQGKHQLAAQMMQKTFFGHEESEEYNPQTPKKKPAEAGDDIDEIAEDLFGEEEVEGEWDGHCIPEMNIVNLPLEEPTTSTTAGFRLATSGARIYRPALRRPILPQRLFIKRAPVEAGGVILFDASGSMGVDKELLLDCCRRAPMATIGFYSGPDDGDSPGTLWIFAKDGMRARNFNEEDIEGGNTVDGRAMDWMIQQEGPRIFVTDRGFCGSADSSMRVVQLKQWEDAGEVTVHESYEAFKEAYPQPQDYAVA